MSRSAERYRKLYLLNKKNKTFQFKNIFQIHLSDLADTCTDLSLFCNLNDNSVVELSNVIVKQTIYYIIVNLLLFFRRDVELFKTLRGLYVSFFYLLKESLLTRHLRGVTIK